MTDGQAVKDGGEKNGYRYALAWFLGMAGTLTLTHSAQHGRCVSRPRACYVTFTTSPSLGKSIRVRLRGEGVRPVLTMLPADGRLDMGHVLEGDTLERWVFVVAYLYV